MVKMEMHLKTKGINRFLSYREKHLERLSDPDLEACSKAIDLVLSERDKSWEQLMRQLIDGINKLPVYADTHNDGVMKGRTIDLIKKLIMGDKDGKKS